MNEEWDLVVVDDLFWYLGYSLTVLRDRLRRRGLAHVTSSHFIFYATSGRTLFHTEVVRSSGRDWVSTAPVFPFLPDEHAGLSLLYGRYQPKFFLHRLHALYENFIELVSLDVIGRRRPCLISVDRIGCQFSPASLHYQHRTLWS